MGMFRNRPLALASICLMLTAAGAYLLSFSVALVCAAIAASALITVLLLGVIRRFTYRHLIAVLVCVGILLGAGRVIVTRYHARSLLGAHMSAEVTATLEVKEIYTRSTYGSRLRVKLTELNGKACRADVLLVTSDFTPLQLGDRVSGVFVCTELEKNSTYEGQESEYVADGVYAALSPAEDSVLSLVESGSNSLIARLADLQGSLRYRLTSIVEGEQGELLSALLLGTRDALDGSTVRDFRRVGLSHLLALSGLHLAILAGVFEGFLRLLHVGKRPRVWGLLIFCFAYLVLTGNSFSMLRAVLMLTIVRLAFFAKGDYDAFTALCLGGALMVLITPNAVFDLSFQMTMLATFGILAFGESQTRLTRWLPRKKGIVGAFFALLRTVLSSLLITLSATIAILPIQWLVFGEMSILSPLSNLLMIPLTMPVLTLGLLMLALLPIPAAASVVGVPAGLIAKLMLSITERLSLLDGMLSLQYGFVPYILIPLFVLTAALLIVDLKKRTPLVLLPTALAALAFAVCLAVSYHAGKDAVELMYRNTGSNEGFLLVQNGSAVVCDISNGSQTQMYENYLLLQEQCVTEVEVLMLTHYHERQVTTLAHFCDSVLIRALWVPAPITETDRAVLADLLTVAAREGIPITVYEHGTPLTVFGTGQITVAAPIFEERSVEPALCLELSFGGETVSYQSAAYSEYARHANAESGAAGRYLILGGHGPVPHEAIVPQVEGTPEEIIIGSEKVLEWYEPSLDTRYILFPEIREYLLQ